MKEKKRDKGKVRKQKERKGGMDGKGQARVSVGAGLWAPGEAVERSDWARGP
jgi:hypothetical protein